MNHLTKVHLSVSNLINVSFWREKNVNERNYVFPARGEETPESKRQVDAWKRLGGERPEADPADPSVCERQRQPGGLFPSSSLAIQLRFLFVFALFSRNMSVKIECYKCTTKDTLVIKYHCISFIGLFVLLFFIFFYTQSALASTFVNSAGCVNLVIPKYIRDQDVFFLFSVSKFIVNWAFCGYFRHLVSHKWRITCLNPLFDNIIIGSGVFNGLKLNKQIPESTSSLRLCESD